VRLTIPSFEPGNGIEQHVNISDNCLLNCLGDFIGKQPVNATRMILERLVTCLNAERDRAHEAAQKGMKNAQQISAVLKSVSQMQHFFVEPQIE
jgi:hypothetical protein